MQPISTNLRIYLKDNLNVGESVPSCEVRVYNQYVNTGPPHIIKNLQTIDLDRRSDASSQELTFVIEDEDGRYSPDYKPSKFPYLDLLSTGYQQVFSPNNKVEVWMGYGDEQILQFTGTIDKVSINSENAELEITCRDNMKYLIDQIIVPDDSRYLNYPVEDEQPWLASAILSDLITRAGCIAEVEDSIFDGTPYVIPAISYQLGTKFIDAVKKITDAIGYKVYATRFGTIRAERIEFPDQAETVDLVLYDYVNLTGADYVIDDQDCRNRLIIAGPNAWEEYHNAGFDTWFDPKFPRIAKIDIPWADSPEKRQMAAKAAFAMMSRTSRRITVGAKAHPGVDIGDVAQLRDTVTTASMKYRVMAIKTTMEQDSYYDALDLEFIVSVAATDATPTGRFFGDAVVNWAPRDYHILDKEVKAQSFDLLGSLTTEAIIRVMSADGAHIGGNIRLIKDETDILRVTTDFNYDAMLEECRTGRPKRLADRGVPDYATGLALKNYVENTLGGKILYISSAVPTPVNSSFIAIISSTLHTKNYDNDTINLRFLNITSLCGRPAATRTIGWKIRMVVF